MPKIHIWTEQSFRNKGYMDEINRQWINANEVYDILNTETGEGPYMEYVVLEERSNEPNKGKLTYDGINYIFLEREGESPVIFAEIRGSGSGLNMDANAHRLVKLWNENI